MQDRHRRDANVLAHHDSAGSFVNYDPGGPICFDSKAFDLSQKLDHI
jgi:hypothetical protein